MIDYEYILKTYHDAMTPQERRRGKEILDYYDDQSKEAFAKRIIVKYGYPYMVLYECPKTRACIDMDPGEAGQHEVGTELSLYYRPDVLPKGDDEELTCGHCGSTMEYVETRELTLKPLYKSDIL